MEKWENVDALNIKVYYFPSETTGTEDADYITYSSFRAKYYVERTLQDLINNRRIGFLRFRGEIYPIR